MDSRPTTATFVTLAVVSVTAGLAAYALYFDYKRRNDPEFRRKIKKEKRRVQKSVAQIKESQPAESGAAPISQETLRDTLRQLAKEPQPKTSAERENYFMAQVGLGEQLALQGPQSHLVAAMAFYRALRVYPSPVELMVIYEKTIPEAVFKIVMEMTQVDIGVRIEAYYDYFPPKRLGVSVITKSGTSGKDRRQVLVVDKDVKAGEVIYKEYPLVTSLDWDLHNNGSHCSQCLRFIDGEPVKFSPRCFPQTYCSEECKLTAKKQHNSLLFTLEPPIPPEMAVPMDHQAEEDRHVAESSFADYCKDSGITRPLLTARFISRQVGIETDRIAESTLGAMKKTPPSTPAVNDFTDAEDNADKYSLGDHLERLRFLEIKDNEEEEKLLREVLKTAMPGLEEFITASRHAVIAGKMAYNAFGVFYGEGRDDRPAKADARPEDLERTRTPYGTQRQVGSAFYTVSSYLTHSCIPSARPAFLGGNAEISIVATRDLKKGDELTISFVDVTQHEGESIVECRRRRRFEIARGWHFACLCERCKEEGETMTLEEKGGAASDEQERDGSKLEQSVQNYSGGAPRTADAADVE